MTKQMQAIAVNGSPRKNWNTASLLRYALDGAKNAGAEIQMVNLYDLDFRGCVSCFACKRKDGEFTGRCAMQDDLTEWLERITDADILFLGSPIYIGDITGAMRSFFERLIFMSLAYRKSERSNFRGRVSTGLIYTMGIPGAFIENSGYSALFESHVKFLAYLKGNVEYMAATDMYQFDDYSKYEASLFDETHKANVRQEQFPLDCKRAFDMGKRLTETH